MSPLAVERQYDFSGGLNSHASPTTVGDNDITNCQNVFYDLDGALVARDGITKVLTNAIGANAITSQTRYYKNDGTTRHHVFFYNQTMYRVNSASQTSIDATAYTAGSVFTFVTFNNVLYWCNGVEAPREWDGTTNAAMSGSPPTAKYYTGSTTARRLFAAGDTSNPYRLYFSALGNPEDWTTANDAGFIDVVTDDGEPIMGIKEINGVLAIFKKSSTHILSGADPQSFTLRQVNSEVGCIAPYSIAASDRELFFLSNKQDFYGFNGTVLRNISKKITTTIASMVQAQLVNCQAQTYRNRYIAAVTSTGTTNDTLLDYNYIISKEGAWTKHSGISVASMTTFHGENGELYTGDYAGNLHQFNSGTTDNGTAIVAWADTPWHYGKEPERRKKYKRTYVVAEPTGSYDLRVYPSFDGIKNTTSYQSVSLAGSGDLFDSTFVFDSSEFGSSDQPFKTFNVSTFGQGRSVLLRFYSTGKFRLYGYSSIQRKKYLR